MLGHSCGNIWHDLAVNAVGLLALVPSLAFGIHFLKHMFRKECRQCPEEKH